MYTRRETKYSIDHINDPKTDHVYMVIEMCYCSFRWGPIQNFRLEYGMYTII